MTGESLCPRVRLGLRENWQQFTLLVLVNAFVGGMVGLERTVVPLVGSQEFGPVLKTAIFSFIITSGLVRCSPNSSPASRPGCKQPQRRHELGRLSLVPKAVYPAVWGTLQIVTSPLSNRYCPYLNGETEVPNIYCIGPPPAVSDAVHPSEGGVSGDHFKNSRGSITPDTNSPTLTVVAVR